MAKLILAVVLFFVSLPSLSSQLDEMAQRRFAHVEQLINENINKSDIDKLNAVGWFNLFDYVSDKVNYGKNDYWATPSEFITRGTGDCEDYVIAKYFTLKRMHMSVNKLYFITGKLNNIGHIVLAYNNSSDYLILDNAQSPIKTLKEYEKSGFKTVNIISAKAIEKIFLKKTNTF